MGVWREKEMDEFDSIGLGAHRRNESFIDEAF
jgi:hypothetical protein